MAKYVLKIRCGCELKPCRRAIHVLGNPGCKRVRVAITDDGEQVGNVILNKKEARELGRWLLDLPEPKKRTTKKVKNELLPWESND
jgi:hypothetical protein